MKIFHIFALLCSLQAFALGVDFGQVVLSEPQKDFLGKITTEVHSLEGKNAGATQEADGWLFLTSELRFLSVGHFWGDDAPKVSRASNPDSADPIPAIVDFRNQLKERGIDLLLVPVPPKASIYSAEIAPAWNAHGEDAAPCLHCFYNELRAKGVDVLDLTALFLKNHDNKDGAVFCKTDTHWSGVGCMLAAQAIADNIRPRLGNQPAAKEYVSQWKETSINGDLIDLLAPDIQKPSLEKIRVRSVSEKSSGLPVEPDEESPVLLIGDSHVLVFHDFLAERAGLLDQLTVELGFAPDVIGTRGSGATPVRLNLYRKSIRNPAYLEKKKIVVWCFTAREFTEADQGWQKLPVAKSPALEYTGK